MEKLIDWTFKFALIFLIIALLAIIITSTTTLSIWGLSELVGVDLLELYIRPYFRHLLGI